MILIGRDIQCLPYAGFSLIASLLYKCKARSSDTKVTPGDQQSAQI